MHNDLLSFFSKYIAISMTILIRHDVFNSCIFVQLCALELFKFKNFSMQTEIPHFMCYRKKEKPTKRGMFFTYKRRNIFSFGSDAFI